MQWGADFWGVGVSYVPKRLSPFDLLPLSGSVLQKRRQEGQRGLLPIESIPNRRPSPRQWRSTLARLRKAAEPPQEGAVAPPGASAVGPPYEDGLDTTHGELVWVRARIAALEAELNHLRSVPGSSSAVYQRESGCLGGPRSGSPIPPAALDLVDKQQGAAVVEGLLQQRGILRELLRAELRDIAKGRKREPGGSGSGHWSCPPAGDKGALHGNPVASSGGQRGTLVAVRQAALEVGSAPPSLVIPHPPSHSPEAAEHTLQPIDAEHGPAYWSGDDGSANESSSEGEQRPPQLMPRFIAACGPSSLSGAESSGMDGRCSERDPRNFPESPRCGASESDSARGKGVRVAQPNVGDAHMSVVLESAADGPNDLVRIVQRRNGGRLRRPSR
jgi:hypothetical protein